MTLLFDDRQCYEIIIIPINSKISYTTKNATMYLTFNDEIQRTLLMKAMTCLTSELILMSTIPFHLWLKKRADLINQVHFSSSQSLEGGF